jgi:hypothetical protein
MRLYAARGRDLRLPANTCQKMEITAADSRGVSCWAVTFPERSGRSVRPVREALAVVRCDLMHVVQQAARPARGSLWLPDGVP